MRDLDVEIDSRELDRQALRGGRHVPPQSPLTRDQDARDRIKGAPLWQVCDFRTSVTSEDRAGLEAALESAGLLDALITPEGTIEPSEACDTFFTRATRRPYDQTVLAWLHPDVPPNDIRVAGLTAEAVESALRYIAIAEEAGEHWVDTSGRWQLGPVRGRGRKALAQHIGESTREAERQRRLAQLSNELAELNERKLSLEGQGEEIKRRSDAIRIEREAAPSDDLIAGGLAVRGNIRTRLRHAREEYEGSQGATRVVRKEYEDALSEKARVAGDFGLSQWAGEPEALRDRWRGYVHHGAELWPTARLWAVRRREVERANEKLDHGKGEVLKANARKRQCELALQEASTRYLTLNSSVGSSVKKLQDDMSRAKASFNRAKCDREQAETDLNAANTKLNVAEQALKELRERQEETIRSRTEAIEKVRVLATHGLFEDTHPDFRSFESDAWSVTRAVEVAREIERTLAGVDASENTLNARQNDLVNGFTELQTSLGGRGHQPQFMHVDDSLVAVTCPFQGQTLAMRTLHNAVGSEIATQEQLLSAREREIIDNHLIREVATALQDLIRDADARVNDMNAEIERCSTSTGLTLRLKWEPREQDTPATGFIELRRLLLADSQMWTPEEKNSLGQFLHGLTKGTPELGIQSALGRSTFRRPSTIGVWHRFYILRRQNDKWERLTKRRYGTGSGGEKALMLTVPQMAAAAAHYRSAASFAPRLILFDEVFVGIDANVRAKCMGLLEAFGLDFIMTSEREWGAYPTIKGLAIYQLTSQSGINAVKATGWIWNGHQRRPLEPLSATEHDGNSQHGT